jgi:hypothetical protein
VGRLLAFPTNITLQLRKETLTEGEGKLSIVDQLAKIACFVIKIFLASTTADQN